MFKEKKQTKTITLDGIDTGDKYMRKIVERSTGKSIMVDTYDVCVAFGVTNPSLFQAVKKLLCPGTRTVAKDKTTDLYEALNSVDVGIQLEKAYGVIK